MLSIDFVNAVAGFKDRFNISLRLPILLSVLLVVERSDLSNRETILLVAVSTVLISIFAHGLSAKWVAK